MYQKKEVLIQCLIQPIFPSPPLFQSTVWNSKCLKQAEKTLENLLYSATAGQSMPILGAIRWTHLPQRGYHVIVPNQRGYGNSSRPTEVTDYDIEHLSGDLIALLDHYGYEDATFVGHDWGAFVVWGLTLLHPNRVNKVINLSLPYQERGEKPWIEFMEEILGGDFYFVHFNRQPGVADAVFEDNTYRFLRNLYRKNEPLRAPEPGMALINLARAETPLGEPVLSESELAVYVSAFETSGFTGKDKLVQEP